MDIRKVADTLIEVIGIKEDNCINCHQCISVCPVKICSDGSGDVVNSTTSCVLVVDGVLRHVSRVMVELWKSARIPMMIRPVS